MLRPAALTAHGVRGAPGAGHERPALAGGDGAGAILGAGQARLTELGGGAVQRLPEHRSRLRAEGRAGALAGFGGRVPAGRLRRAPRRTARAAGGPPAALRCSAGTCSGQPVRTGSDTVRTGADGRACTYTDIPRQAE